MTNNIQELQETFDRDIETARAQANTCEGWDRISSLQAAAGYRQSVALTAANMIAIEKIEATSRATPWQESLYQDFDKARAKAFRCESYGTIEAFKAAAAYRQSAALTAANIITVEQDKKPGQGSKKTDAFRLQ